MSRPASRMKGSSPDKGGRTRRDKVVGPQTTRCVVCGDEARRFTGHVVRAGKTVVAGWCNVHNPTDYLRSGSLRLGCYAHRCEVTFNGNLRPLRAAEPTEETKP